MSEHLKRHEHLSESEAAHETVEQRSERPEKAEAAETKPVKAEEARKNLEELNDDSASSISQKLSAKLPTADLPPPGRAAKKAALNNYLSQIRTNLNKPSKSFSKFIHNSKVDTLSDAGGKTLLRPYGLLVGGAFALVGSCLYLFYIQHTGYKYNFFVPLMLFAGGFIIGLLFELISKGLASARKKRT